jgi:uncharacterized protein YigA (DUF484 family)
LIGNLPDQRISIPGELCIAINRLQFIEVLSYRDIPLILLPSSDLSSFDEELGTNYMEVLAQLLEVINMEALTRF